MAPLEVPADPLRLARRLVAAGCEHVAMLQGEGWNAAWLAADPDRTSHALDPVVDDDGPALEGPLGAVPRWLGAVPYETRREALERPAWRKVEERAAPPCTRPVWRRYPAVVHVSGDQVRAIGEPDGVARLRDALQREDGEASRAELRVEVPDDERHRARIRRARELILDGHLYQVNLARRIAIAADGEDPFAIYAALRDRSPAAFGAVLSLERGWYALSTSPELLLEATPRPAEGDGWPRFSRLVTEPIKGTRPRGADPKDDAAQRAALDRDPKEQAELAMIVDVERNDLGRVAELGSVRVAQAPYVRTLPTLHHRLARVVAEARPDATRTEVMEAMLPSGSVTGAPKQRAMEVIAELERDRRGLYTGGFGYVARDGGVRLAMAIRTAVVRQGRGHYWTGGGIVVGSDPDREVEETRWKAVQLGLAP